MQPIVIGIAGGTGSGKSTIVNRIKQAVGSEISFLAHDYYYKSNDDLTLEQRMKINYDHPDSLETDLLVEHIRALKRGEYIERPSYDFVNYTRKPHTTTIQPKKVIVVEGILIFENKALFDEMDIKIYVDTDADVRIIRRILRDVQERDRSLMSVVDQYLTTVKMMHEQFVEPSKRNADIIIPEGGYNEVALSMILDKINMML